MSMTPWDHFGKRLLFSVKIFLVLSTLITQSRPTEATSYCSNSFRFDQLCPDPRFGTREIGSMSSPQPDTLINLPSSHNVRVNGGTISSQYGGTSSMQYGGSMSIKDPSTTSCDFHRNGVETSVVTGVHITRNPWDFRHAKVCTNIVKLAYDLFAPGGSQLSGGQTSVTSNAYGSSKKEKTCSKEIGIRRAGNGRDNVAANDELADELARKMDVYFWHNFTLYSHSVQFVDSILNHHLSKEDVSCVDPGTGQYAQIAVIVSRRQSGQCEIIVQQYKIEEKRSRWGCNGTGYPIPYPFQFCGSYECSQINNIITGFKLLSGRGSVPQWNNHHGTGSSSVKTSWHSQHGAGIGESNGAPEGYQPNKNQMQPSVTEGTTASSADDKPVEGPEAKPMDWKELVFLSAFPMCGVFFILIVLNILRSQSAREICMVYTYPRQNEGFQLTSCNPIEIGKGQQFSTIEKEKKNLSCVTGFPKSIIDK